MAETTPVAKPTMEEMRRLVQEEDQKIQRAAFAEAMTKYIPIAKFMEQASTSKFQKEIEDHS